MKKHKIKKYNLGVKDVMNSQGGAIGGMALGLGIDALTQSKVDSKYTSQLKDSNQDTGRAIGQGVGQSLNLLMPGLGTVAAPVLGAAGAAIQRGFQDKKLDQIKKDTDQAEAREKFNENIDSIDITTTQKKQFKDGTKGVDVGKVKLKKNTQKADTTSTSKPKKIMSKEEGTWNSLANQSLSNSTLKIPESEGIKTARKVLRGVDKVATYGQVGNFTPWPVTQAIGKISSGVGVATGLGQAALDTAVGDYEEAGKNLLGAGLSYGVGKFGKTTSKYGKKIKDSNGEVIGLTRAAARYTPIKKNPHLGGALAGEAALNEFKDGSKKVKVSKPVAVGESTKVVRPLEPKIVKGVNDIKDKRTRDYLNWGVLNNVPNNPLTQEQDRMAVNQHFINGNPRVEKKPESEQNTRSEFIHSENKMYLSKADHYLSELAHASQRKMYGEDKMSFKAGRELSKYGDAKRYKVKGTIENEAHEEIEPKLRKLTSREQAWENINVLQNAAKKSKGVKVIEIEGKTTPEIHTDKNFNVKNLGTTPHSKGGDKVLAEEGDVVFPTQNSEKKYKEVMTAIKKGDKSKLKKIQSKLPEDKSPKYDDGTKKVRTTKDEILNGNRGHFGRTIAIESPYDKNKYNGPGHSINEPWAAGFKPKVAPKTTLKPKVASKGASKGMVKRTALVEPSSKIAMPTGFGDTTGLKEAPIDSPKITSPKVETKPYAAKTTESKSKGSGGGLGMGDALELAPIAYNIGQGLFGKAEKVKRNKFNPELEKYTDTSDPLRRQSNSLYSQDKANSRNLSYGVAGNSRANQQAASNSEFGRQNQINSQETSKELDINNRNVGIKNHAKMVNIDLDDRYNEIDSQNKAAKQGMLSQGLTDLGALGSRNKLEASQLGAHQSMIKAGAMGTMYDPIFNKKGYVDRYQFKSDASPEEQEYIAFKNRISKNSKGNKHVRTKYKGKK